jgi:hypothetical protein
LLKASFNIKIFIQIDNITFFEIAKKNILSLVLVQMPSKKEKRGRGLKGKKKLTITICQGKDMIGCNEISRT